MAHRIIWTWITTYILATMDSYTGKQTIRIKQSGSLCEHLLTGGGLQNWYTWLFLSFFRWKFTFCQLRNINVMSHIIYMMLFYKKYCSLYLFPTTYDSSTGVTARNNYVIISIYLPHDPGKIMKRNHKTLKQLIANYNKSIFTLVLTLIRER